MGDAEKVRMYWKELQGLFVMTKLDAKTVIKGDGEAMEIYDGERQRQQRRKAPGY